jgi:hypothetical protein
MMALDCVRERDDSGGNRVVSCGRQGGSLPTARGGVCRAWCGLEACGPWNAAVLTHRCRAGAGEHVYFPFPTREEDGRG